MDPVRNPYAPGAGSPPPELAGRAGLVEDASVSLQRVRIGRASQSTILVGLRGVGKTVLLARMEDVADEFGFEAVLFEAHEGKRIAELLVPRLRELLFRFSRVEGSKEHARRGLRVLRSFVNGLKLTIGDVEVGLGVEPEKGSADSGDLEADLSQLMLVVATAAQAADTAIALLIDEMQYLTPEEFSALIMSVHRVNQKSLPLILIGAGLPQILGLAGNSKSYAERLFRFPEIGALEQTDAESAVRQPAADEGVEFDDGAIAEILRETHRYPYFLQQWAYESWNTATGETITLDDVKRATTAAIASLDESFFKVRLDRCKPSEQRYMRALAELGPGIHRSGAIADLLGLKVTSVGPTRASLITKGMIYSPAHGDNAFTVPLFDEYMRRTMPELR